MIYWLAVKKKSVLLYSPCLESRLIARGAPTLVPRLPERRRRPRLRQSRAASGSWSRVSNPHLGGEFESWFDIYSNCLPASPDQHIGAEVDDGEGSWDEHMEDTEDLKLSASLKTYWRCNLFCKFDKFTEYMKYIWNIYVGRAFKEPWKGISGFKGNWEILTPGKRRWEIWCKVDTAEKARYGCSKSWWG